MTKDLPTDFLDDVDTDEPAKAAVLVDKDEAGVPYCVKHHCRMKQTSGGKKGSAVAYFGCPVDGCEEKAKRVKMSKSVIPADPHLCPRCTGVSPRPILERDAKLSNGFYSILKCPCCGHKSTPMARPEFVASHARSRGEIPAEEIGAR